MMLLVPLVLLPAQSDPAVLLIQVDPGYAQCCDDGSDRVIAATTIQLSPLGVTTMYCCSIGEAQTALRGVHQQQQRLPPGPLVVELAPVSYQGPLRFVEADSGTAANPVIWRGQPGARVVGGMALHTDGFQRVRPSDPVFRRLPPNASHLVRWFDLSAATNLTRADIGDTTPHDRIIGMAFAPAAPSQFGVPLVSARWPNFGWASARGTGPPAIPGGACTDEATCRNLTFSLPGGAPFGEWAARSTDGDTEELLQGDGLWLTAFLSFDWAYTFARIESLTLDKHSGTMRLSANASQAPVTYGVRTWCAGGGRQCLRYHVSGVPEALDRMGEFWIDRARMRLYLVPPPASQSMAPPILLSNLSKVALVAVIGVRYWSVEGITFEATRGDGLVLLGCSNVTVRNSTFTAIGATAVTVRNGASVKLQSCHVLHAGATGVLINAGDHATLTPADVVLNNSRVAHTGLLMPAYRPSVQIAGVGITISHNELSHSPHSAVLMGPAGAFNDITVERNIIHHVVTDTWDSAAVYFQGHDFTSRNLTIRHNLFHSIPQPMASDGATARCTRFEGPKLGLSYDPECGRHVIYADCCGSSGFSVVGNIIWSPELPRGSMVIRNNGNRDMNASGNLVIDATDLGMQTGSALYNTPAVLAAALADMAAVHWQQPPFSRRYPALAELDGFLSLPLLGNCSARATCAAAPFNNIVKNNALVNSSGGNTSRTQATFFGMPARNRSLFADTLQIANNLAATDEQVRWQSQNPRRDLEFRLRANSPLFSRGFEPIPEDIGPHLNVLKNDDLSAGGPVRAALRSVAVAVGSAGPRVSLACPREAEMLPQRHRRPPPSPRLREERRSGWSTASVDDVRREGPVDARARRPTHKSDDGAARASRGRAAAAHRVGTAAGHFTVDGAAFFPLGFYQVWRCVRRCRVCPTAFICRSSSRLICSQPPCPRGLHTTFRTHEHNHSLHTIPCLGNDCLDSTAGARYTSTRASWAGPSPRTTARHTPGRQRRPSCGTTSGGLCPGRAGDTPHACNLPH
jgi:hypothetical protein